MAVFADQTFVVTGASGGIGEAIANAAAREGANICLCGRDTDRLGEVAKRLPSKRSRTYRADFDSDNGADETAKQIMRDHSRVDALIHCAAGIELGALAEASAETFEQQFRLNVVAPFKLTQLLLPHLTANQGQIVFINSSAGLTARAHAGQYSATKHALRAVADSLRQEINSAGVRVCSLFIGDTATPMQERVRKKQGRTYEPARLMQPGDVAAMVVAVLALPRTAEVTDVMMRPMQKT